METITRLFGIFGARLSGDYLEIIWKALDKILRKADFCNVMFKSAWRGNFHEESRDCFSSHSCNFSELAEYLLRLPLPLTSIGAPSRTHSRTVFEPTPILAHMSDIVRKKSNIHFSCVILTRSIRTFYIKASTAMPTIFNMHLPMLLKRYRFIVANESTSPTRITR